MYHSLMFSLGELVDHRHPRRILDATKINFQAAMFILIIYSPILPMELPLPTIPLVGLPCRLLLQPLNIFPKCRLAL